MQRPGMVATIAIAGFFFALTATRAHEFTEVYASPTGSNNVQFSQDQPCTPQAAVQACHAKPAETCRVNLGDGVYIDPAINIYYYRGIDIEGNCKAPQNVILRATKPSPLIFIQDHAIGIVKCLALEASVPGAIGISGRQHIIADYDRVIFGPMRGGTHIALNDFSIATCVGSASVTGDARLHAGIANFSNLNMTCRMALPQPLKFDYFAKASLWSVINAGSFTGPGATASKGIRCHNYLSVVNYPKDSDFPGDSGACSRADLVSDAKLAEEVAGMSAKLNAISSSLAAEQAALDDLQHAENVQRRHDRLIAVIVLLMLIAAGTVAYRQLANRKI